MADKPIGQENTDLDIGNLLSSIFTKDIPEPSLPPLKAPQTPEEIAEFDASLELTAPEFTPPPPPALPQDEQAPVAAFDPIIPTRGLPADEETRRDFSRSPIDFAKAQTPVASISPDQSSLFERALFGDSVNDSEVSAEEVIARPRRDAATLRGYTFSIPLEEPKVQEAFLDLRKLQEAFKAGELQEIFKGERAKEVEAKAEADVIFEEVGGRPDLVVAEVDPDAGEIIFGGFTLKERGFVTAVAKLFEGNNKGIASAILLVDEVIKALANLVLEDHIEQEAGPLVDLADLIDVRLERPDGTKIDVDTNIVGEFLGVGSQLVAGAAVGGAYLKAFKGVSQLRVLSKGRVGLESVGKFLENHKRVRNIIAGAGADAISFTNEEGRVSDLMKDLGADNRIVNFLASNPDESPLSARAKLAAEGVVVTGVFSVGWAVVKGSAGLVKMGASSASDGVKALFNELVTLHETSVATAAARVRAAQDANLTSSGVVAKGQEAANTTLTEITNFFEGLKEVAQAQMDVMLSDGVGGPSVVTREIKQIVDSTLAKIDEALPQNSTPHAPKTPRPLGDDELLKIVSRGAEAEVAGAEAALKGELLDSDIINTTAGRFTGDSNDTLNVVVQMARVHKARRPKFLTPQTFKEVDQLADTMGADPRKTIDQMGFAAEIGEDFTGFLEFSNRIINAHIKKLNLFEGIVDPTAADVLERVHSANAAFALFQQQEAIIRNAARTLSVVRKTRGNLVGVDIFEDPEFFEVMLKGSQKAVNFSTDEILTNPQKSREFSKLMNILKLAKGKPAAMREIMSRTPTQRSARALFSVMFNSMLSGPKTLGINIVSGPGMVLLLTLERTLSDGITGLQGGNFRDEMSANFRGLQGLLSMGNPLTSPINAPEAVVRKGGAKNLNIRENVLKAIKDSTSSVDPGAAILDAEYHTIVPDISYFQVFGKSKEDLTNDAARFAAEAFDILGVTVRAPSSMLSGTDEFVKLGAMRQKIYKDASRQARQAFKRGEITPGQLNAYEQELIAHPTQAMWDAARAEGQRVTFTRTPAKDSIGGNVMSVLRAIDNNTTNVPTLRAIVPFQRVPINIMRENFDRTPGLAFLLKENREIFKQGGRELNDLAVRQMTGTALILGGFKLRLDGMITGGGPQNPAARQNWLLNFRPYSIRGEDENGNVTWREFDRADPAFFPLALSADFIDITASLPENRRDMIATAIITALSRSTLNKQYISGAVDMMAAIVNNNPEGIQRARDRIALSFIPFGSLAKAVRREQDPVIREVFSIIDAAKNSIPTFSETLPPARDGLGRIRYHEPLIALNEMPGTFINDVFEFITPFEKTVIPKDEYYRIVEETIRVGYDLTPLNSTQSFDGVLVPLETLGPEVHERLQQIFFVGLRIVPSSVRSDFQGLGDNRPMFFAQMLSNLFNSKVYKAAPMTDIKPSSGKVGMIQIVKTTFLREAKKALVLENEDLQNLSGLVGGLGRASEVGDQVAIGAFENEIKGFLRAKSSKTNQVMNKFLDDLQRNQRKRDERRANR